MLDPGNINSSACIYVSPWQQTKRALRLTLRTVVLPVTPQDLLREHLVVTLFLTMLVGAGGNAGMSRHFGSSCSAGPKFLKPALQPLNTRPVLERG